MLRHTPTHTCQPSRRPSPGECTLSSSSPSSPMKWLPAPGFGSGGSTCAPCAAAAAAFGGGRRKGSIADPIIASLFFSTCCWKDTLPKIRPLWERLAVLFDWRPCRQALIPSIRCRRRCLWATALRRGWFAPLLPVLGVPRALCTKIRQGRRG